VIYVFPKTLVPVIVWPIETVPVTLETVNVVPEIEPVAEKEKADDAVTIAEELLYPVGVKPATLMVDPTGMV
jgi:hypothetical protein